MNDGPEDTRLNPSPRAKKSLGQNFLIDPNLQRKIVDALGPVSDRDVLEIGSGPGALTRHLVDRAGRLTLVELDDELAARLNREYGTQSSVQVLHTDVLSLDLPSLFDDFEAISVIGNIPYNITTPILFKLLEQPRPAQIVLMVQEEVADRVVSPPGRKSYGALSVGVQTVARVERLFRVPSSAFRPRPRVDSAVIRLQPLRPAPLSVFRERRLRVLIRAAFQWRRKQLKKILRDHPDIHRSEGEVAKSLADLDLDPHQRPETLTPRQFIELSKSLEHDPR